MRKLIMSIILGSTCCVAQDIIETKWAQGVNERGGWVDVDKTWANDDDDNMCYAASAANIMTWWQRESNLISEAPKDASAIWDTYREACLNPEIGGYPIAAMNWWISGVYLPTSPEQMQRSYYTFYESETLKTFDGYYYDEYSLNWYDLGNLYEGFMSYDDSLFGMLLDKGAGVSLSIADDSGNLAHAITLWGTEYTNDTLTKIWVTDSDDYNYGLIPVDVFTDETSGKLYFDHSEDAEIGYYRNIVDLNRNPLDDIYVSGIYTFNAFETKNWQLAIPEPTTAALSLLALAGLAARRRRGTY